MKSILTTRIAAGLFALLPFCGAWAQVELSIDLVHDKILLHESAPVRVEIRNNTANPIRLGDPGAPSALLFDVAEPSGQLARRTRRNALREAITIDPWRTTDVTADLLDSVALYRPGPYTVSARLALAERFFSSNKAYLDVVSGLTLAEIRAAGPPDGDLLTFSLLGLQRERAQFIFLKVLHPAKNVSLGVFPLGRMVPLLKPQMMFDRDGRLHVLHQSGPDRYTHSVYAGHGSPLTRVFHSPGAGRTALVRDAEGGVNLTGVSEYSGDRYSVPREYDWMRERPRGR
jgi:hypothetical protein